MASVLGSAVDPAAQVRWLSRHMVAILVTSAALFALPALLHWAGTGTLILGDFLDVTVYRAGGSALLRGEPLYAADLPVAAGAFPFTYPPFAAVLFTPLTLLPSWLCRALVIPVHLGLLTAVVRTCLRRSARPAGAELKRATMALTALVFLLEPLAWTMWLGQINLVLLAVVLWDLTGRSRWAGVGAGIAAGIKLTPALFIGYLLVTRRSGRRARRWRPRRPRWASGSSPPLGTRRGTGAAPSPRQGGSPRWQAGGTCRCTGCWRGCWAPGMPNG